MSCDVLKNALKKENKCTEALDCNLHKIRFQCVFQLNTDMLNFFFFIFFCGSTTQEG